MRYLQAPVLGKCSRWSESGWILTCVQSLALFTDGQERPTRRSSFAVVSGQSLDPHESEVSVLFVDIRGYTSYAEDKSAAEVFSTVNRYTESVSRIVRAHGGTVVEFNGDGMMAVFGAPAPMVEKERAAVATAREIVFSVRSLELGPQRQQPALEVGVGIATGKAFVGNIQSIDRLIWSAIGDTPNLAARLQGLTRELNASVIIDSATCRSIGEAAADFEPHQAVPIRGRRQTADIYVLPLVTSDGAAGSRARTP